MKIKILSIFIFLGIYLFSVNLFSQSSSLGALLAIVIFQIYKIIMIAPPKQ